MSRTRAVPQQRGLLPAGWPALGPVAADPPFRVAATLLAALVWTVAAAGSGPAAPAARPPAETTPAPDPVLLELLGSLPDTDEDWAAVLDWALDAADEGVTEP